MRLSVMIPIHNGGDDLRRCLEAFSDYAEQEALEWFLNAKQRAEQPGFKNAVFQSGLVPGLLVKVLASRYFAARLQ